MKWTKTWTRDKDQPPRVMIESIFIITQFYVMFVVFVHRILLQSNSSLPDRTSVDTHCITFGSNRNRPVKFVFGCWTSTYSANYLLIERIGDSVGSPKLKLFCNFWVFEFGTLNTLEHLTKMDFSFICFQLESWSWECRATEKGNLVRVKNMQLMLNR